MRVGLLGAAVAAIIMASGSGAVAFQFVNPDTNPDGTSTKFSTDPDQPSQSPSNRFQSGNGSASTLKFGNSTLQFGFSGGSNSNTPAPWIQERFLQSPAARTVPSQGW